MRWGKDMQSCFAAGLWDVERIGCPCRIFIGELFLDLLVNLPFPTAVIDFAKAHHADRLGPVRLRHERRRLNRALHVATVKSVNLHLRQSLPKFPRQLLRPASDKSISDDPANRSSTLNTVAPWRATNNPRFHWFKAYRTRQSTTIIIAGLLYFNRRANHDTDDFAAG